MGHSSKVSFSNTVIDSLCDSGFTRDVPKHFQGSIFGNSTSVCDESATGRGAPFFDVWRRTDKGCQALSIKVGQKSPTDIAAPIVGTGTLRFVEDGLLLAMEAGYPMPVLVVTEWEGNWYVASFDMTEIYKAHGWHERIQGKGKGRGMQRPGVILGISTRRYNSVKRGPTVYEYVDVSVNLKANGIEWVCMGEYLDIDLADYAGDYSI